MSKSENRPEINICWLSELQKYSKTPETSPTENFLTTALAWALESHQELKTRFLKELFPHYKGNFENAKVEPQRPLDVQRDGKKQRIPDFTVIEDGAVIAFIEFKVDSPPDPEQVSFYQAYLQEHHPGNCGCAFISFVNYCFDTKPIIKCATWDQVYEIIDRVYSVSRPPLIQALLHYMRRNNMGQLNSVSSDAQRTIDEFWSMHTTITRIVDRSVSILKISWDGSKLRSRKSTSSWYYGYKFQCFDKIETYVFMEWQSNVPLAWVIQLIPNKGERPAFEYERAAQHGSGWVIESGTPGMVRRLDIDKDFFNLTGDIQAQNLAEHTIRELKKLRG